MRTERETTVTDDTVPMAFNLNSSVTMKLPMFPAPTTAKERKTIALFVRERNGFEIGNEERCVTKGSCGMASILCMLDPLNDSVGRFD